jgi:hypothetical protein
MSVNWYWGTQMGRRHGQSVWYGVSVSKGPLRFTLLWIRTAKVTYVTADELYERLRDA